ncbi:MAG: sigma-70 family RNA polymerase sigma factor [Bacteroidales bacterium]|jgi:RNA polymerase sigma-70 factor (ECF subfamily)|nr:sigma-70 family RNA polymerase sigma factor [Bacteroidales bacterium]MCB9028693.1 sigma-70 family RNA polymerase sigma factor [Bacteroidales bacterium]NLD64458.1 sigma-70 family RNA polymerase sigma factor [Bacteroidales bacterium]HNT93506.1 sigma-70 family RNA polymerase sigma factor [Bacteroidales bacterium]HOO66253.1 sigma-70 family RNA polymerase sigma factor [Bacteroidales bacterium]
MMSEQHIIDGCIRHNRKAQQALWRHYSGYLLGVCMRYAADRPEAEDMLQEAFLKIYFNLREYSGTGSFRGWLRKVTVNTAITYYHKNLKHKHQVDIDEYVSIETGTSGFEEDFCNAEDLYRVLGELSPGYRMVFNLFAIEGYRHHEIAEKLGIDVNTSKSQYSRARAILRKRLGELARMKGRYT